MYDSTQDKKDYKFKISIENDESNVYEIIVYIYITTSDNNNYYSLSQVILIHLSMQYLIFLILHVPFYHTFSLKKMW